MTTQSTPVIVSIDTQGNVFCGCGRFAIQLLDTALLSMLREHGIKFLLPACKGCRERCLVDFGAME